MVHRTTKQETQGRTDANGRYRFVRLVPGAYEVSIESPGFASYKRQVAVREGEVLNKEVTLEVGATMGVIVEVTEDIQLLPSKINLTPKLRRAK
jgi:hypothetical protein